MNEKEIKYILAPLNTVDIKSLQILTDKLKNSKDKTYNAVGAFLNRYIAHYSDELPGHQPSSGLADLKDLS